MAQRLQLLQQLRETPVGLCMCLFLPLVVQNSTINKLCHLYVIKGPLLHSSLLSGVAYHHAGLTMDERKLLEEAYRKGVVVVVSLLI